MAKSFKKFCRDADDEWADDDEDFQRKHKKLEKRRNQRIAKKEEKLASFDSQEDDS